MAQGRSTKIISTIKWIRTSRLSIKTSLSPAVRTAGEGEIGVHVFVLGCERRVGGYGHGRCVCTLKLLRVHTHRLQSRNDLVSVRICLEDVCRDNPREPFQARAVSRFQGGLVCKAHRWLFHSTLGSRVMTRRERENRLVLILSTT